MTVAACPDARIDPLKQVFRLDRRSEPGSRQHRQSPAAAVPSRNARREMVAASGREVGCLAEKEVGFVIIFSMMERFP